MVELKGQSASLTAFPTGYFDLSFIVQIQHLYLQLHREVL